MATIQIDQIPSREILPGFHVRFVHAERVTIAFFTIEEGSQLPEHQHFHEQVSEVIEGRFELILDGESHILEPGKVLVIPSNVPHSGRALTPCRIKDIFMPVREDYKSDLQTLGSNLPLD